jgi:hypothetical protein
MASTAIRPETPEDVAIRENSRKSGLDGQDLPAPVNAGLWIHAVGPEKGAICRISGELRSLEGVGSAAVGTAALGLFTFRIGHGWEMS